MRPRAGAILIGLAAILVTTFAHAQGKDAGNATDAVNPHSPRYGHPYRHGAHPTREQHEKMRGWAAEHRGEFANRAVGKANAAAATGTQMLSFNGGVDG